MEAESSEWAITLLEQQVEMLGFELPELRRHIDVDPALIEEKERQYRSYRDRLKQINEEIEAGISVDLHPEFSLLCDELVELMREDRKWLVANLTVHSFLSGSATVTAN